VHPPRSDDIVHLEAITLFLKARHRMAIGQHSGGAKKRKKEKEK